MRPLINKGIEVLERLFDEAVNQPAQLKLLAEELKHRNVPKAVRLRQKVAAAIARTSGGGGEPAVDKGPLFRPSNAGAEVGKGVLEEEDEPFQAGGLEKPISSSGRGIDDNTQSGGFSFLFGDLTDGEVEASEPVEVLSRDSELAPRIGASLPVEVVHRSVDGVIEARSVGEGLMGQMMRFEIVPNNLDVVELGRVFGQPLDDKPMLCASSAARVSLLTWIGPLSSTSTTGFTFRPGLGP